MAPKFGEHALVGSPDVPQGAVEFGQDEHQFVPGEPPCLGVDQLEERGRQRQQRQRVHPRAGGPARHLDAARIDDLVELDAPRQVQAEAAEAHQ
ncbi:hypothetical protein ACIA6E_11225 [Streptomyces sp. NPDC051815]|uniref:hypothetical protein n=1 Tax=Streptomyces sp. NPDC051815 TaxID=3365674 RepID=UPI0037903DC2